jgi:short-subunit dehydrogenase
MPSSRPLAVVTGASGGLGLDMARILARRGYDVVLAARSVDRLESIRDQIESQARTRAFVAAHDLSTRPGVDRLLHDIALLDRPVDLLVNNAGFGLHGPYLETEPASEVAMIQVNVLSLVRLTRALLPDMVARGSGRVLQVASTAGFMPGPLMSTYYATKAFVLSYSDALAEELRGTGVSMTCLCPGPTRTGFQARAGARRAGAGELGAMESEAVARAGLDGALSGRRRVVPGLINKLSTWVPRVLPRNVLTALVGRIQRSRR